MIFGSLDGIETGVRQLIRQAPLETTKVTLLGEEVTLPTLPEMLRIKAILILKRNATRDYLDFAALADALGPEGAGAALSRLDELYPQDSGQSALQQLLVQISAPSLMTWRMSISLNTKTWTRAGTAGEKSGRFALGCPVTFSRLAALPTPLASS